MKYSQLHCPQQKQEYGQLKMAHFHRNHKVVKAAKDPFWVGQDFILLGVSSLLSVSSRRTFVVNLDIFVNLFNL